MSGVALKVLPVTKGIVDLLNSYIANEIDSDTYIEETLNLLSQNKSNLKISAITSKM